jgi:hypothetical protein
VFADALDWASDSHLVNATYAVADPLQIEGFYHWLSFTTPIAARPGRLDRRPWRQGFGQGLGFALPAGLQRHLRHQTNVGANPGRFGHDYYAADVAGTFDIHTVKVSYEQLNGDGVR